MSRRSIPTSDADGNNCAAHDRAQRAFAGVTLAGVMVMAIDTILMALMIGVIMVALVAISAAALANGDKDKV